MLAKKLKAIKIWEQGKDSHTFFQSDESSHTDKSPDHMTSDTKPASQFPTSKRATTSRKRKSDVHTFVVCGGSRQGHPAPQKRLSLRLIVPPPGSQDDTEVGTAPCPDPGPTRSTQDFSNCTNSFSFTTHGICPGLCKTRKTNKRLALLLIGSRTDSVYARAVILRDSLTTSGQHEEMDSANLLTILTGLDTATCQHVECSEVQTRTRQLTPTGTC